MEGIVDVYEQYFINLEESKFHFFKRYRHTCLVCKQDNIINGSYGEFDRKSIEKVIIEYLEHLKIFGFSYNLAKVFINSIRDSGVLCKNVKGSWEFEEHKINHIFIIEHCIPSSIVESEIEIEKKEVSF